MIFLFTFFIKKKSECGLGAHSPKINIKQKTDFKITHFFIKTIFEEQINRFLIVDKGIVSSGMKFKIMVTFSVMQFTLIAQPTFQLGVNLDDNGAFVNIVNHTNRYTKATAYDSLGWPASDFDLTVLDGRPATEWNSVIDDPETYRVDYSGRYACSFVGIANIVASGTSVAIENKSYDSASNTTFFELVVGGFPNANHGLAILSFTNTRRIAGGVANKGISKLKVNRPGYPINSNKIFTDAYIQLCKAADFACYRFYNLQNIWDAEPTYPAKTKWENRKTPLDASQKPMGALNGKRDAWCWEYMVTLANELKKNIWINIPISCDSDYVNNLAKYLQSTLDPNISIYVENSNEVWSQSQNTHGPYNQAQAVANGINFDQNYARRSVELSNWFAYVFGSNEINKRIRVVLAGQQAFHGRSDNHLNYIKNKIGEPKNYIYANSTALYFNSAKSSSTNPLDINDGMIDDIDSQITIATRSTYRLNHINKANTWNLPGGCVSYEGGPHVPSGGGTSNLGNQILSHRTSKMREIIELNYLQGWEELGGGLAMYFTLYSAYSRFGCWGLTDDYTNPERNFKMQAVRNIIQSYTGIEKPTNHKHLSIYPNPANNHITVGIKNTSITIYSIVGEAILTTTVDKGSTVDISTLKPGLYVVYSGDYIGKFMKE